MAVHNHTSIDDGVHEVLFSHQFRQYQNLGFNLTQCVSDIWSTMCAYGGWACSIEVHASGCEVLDPGREVSSLKFEPAIKGSHYRMSCLLYAYLRPFSGADKVSG
jgi:hypothetical protein